MGIFNWLNKKSELDDKPQKTEKAKAVFYEKGFYEDDLGYDSFVTYHKCIAGKIKAIRIKQLLDWESHKFELIKIIPLSKVARVLVIQKGTGRERVYNKRIIELIRNNKVKRIIKIRFND